MASSLYEPLVMYLPFIKTLGCIMENEEGRKRENMKVSFQGIYSLQEFFQALYEEHQNFEKLGIKYIRRAHLHYTPVDEHGDPVVPTDPDTGRPAKNWKKCGAYKSAARDYGL